MSLLFDLSAMNIAFGPSFHNDVALIRAFSNPCSLNLSATHAARSFSDGYCFRFQQWMLLEFDPSTMIVRQRNAAPKF